MNQHITKAQIAMLEALYAGHDIDYQWGQYLICCAMQARGWVKFTYYFGEFEHASLTDAGMVALELARLEAANSVAKRERDI